MGRSVRVRLRLGILILLTGVIACDNQLVDALRDANNSIKAPVDQVRDCARADVREFGPYFATLLDAALSDDRPAVRTFELRDGTQVEFTLDGPLGSALVIGVPATFTGTYSLPTPEPTDQPIEFTLTREAGGLLRMNGSVHQNPNCAATQLSELEIVIDPLDLPEFKPSGTATIFANAGTNYDLDGGVTFDGNGGVSVDGWVSSFLYGPYDRDFSVMFDQLP